jgi:anthranilate synthase/aminodeoxychorismate synthase-like glutamine amidotransferase
MLLILDNYDSFVHNLARYFERLGQVTQVIRSDAMDADGVRRLKPDAVVLSPGPCSPREAGHSLDIVRYLHTELPLLGVCLGHQVIAEALGGKVVRAAAPVHGQATRIVHDGEGLFADLPSPLCVGRYHSLVVEPKSLPPVLRPTAWSEGAELMAFEHATLPVFGVQFHPESILTEHGYELLANFLRRADCRVDADVDALAANETAQEAPASAS